MVMVMAWRQWGRAGSPSLPARRRSTDLAARSNKARIDAEIRRGDGRRGWRVRHVPESPGRQGAMVAQGMGAEGGVDGRWPWPSSWRLAAPSLTRASPARSGTTGGELRQARLDADAQPTGGVTTARRTALTLDRTLLPVVLCGGDGGGGKTWESIGICRG
jgi:hypothetical protein